MFPALMHAAIFGNVAAIIQKLYANRVRYHSRANEIKQFIRVQRIEQDLSNRLEDYFHNTWSLSGGVDTREVGIRVWESFLEARFYRLMLEYILKPSSCYTPKNQRDSFTNRVRGARS